MKTDPTKITDEEITQYRQQFVDYPEALDALDLIEENEGDLQQTASLLAYDSDLAPHQKKIKTSLM